MSVERYSTRRHHLNSLTAKMGGGRTVAERAAFIRARPSLKNVAVKPKPCGKAQAARQRRLRVAEAEASMTPAPKPKRGPLAAPEACASFTVGGSSFDRAPTIHAAAGAAPATSTAAKRMNVQATHKQRLQRLSRAEADMRR
jgi:hypothetical protein